MSGARHACCATLISLVAQSVTAGNPTTERSTTEFRVRIRGSMLAGGVRDALERASRRLDSDDCAAIFSDFSDGEGRPLSATLDSLGQSAHAYLRTISFYDGQSLRRCLDTRVLAVTAPGSRVVWICPQFGPQQKRDTGLAEVVLLHEMLHSLGLRENPPSGAEITSRVVARCGR